MELSRELAQMDAEALRNLTATLLAQLTERDAALSAKDAQLANRDQELKAKQLKIDQLTHEMAILKRWHFDRRSDQSRTRSPEREAVVAAEGTAAPCSAPRGLPAPGDPSRAGKYPMQLWLWSRAHRRGCEREARLHARGL
jgi:hypothetical protein